ncbi:MAG: oligosaccharide flippase family protein [Candidatus Brachytrichaceae bacterium NZ_4S206]|jgi:O-antigen/teichoic acid export membrane protein
MTVTERLKSYRDAVIVWRTGQLSKHNALVVTFVRGIFAAISGTTLAYLLGAITTVLIARELGVNGYGEYATIMASLGLLSNLLGLGLDTWLVGEGARLPHQLNALAWQVLFLKAAGSFAMMSVLTWGWLSGSANAAVFIIGSLGVIADGFSRTGFAMLRARAQNGRVAVLEVAAPALLLAGLFVLKAIGFTVVALVTVQLVCNAIVTAATFANAFDEIKLPTPAPWRVLREGWIFVASDVVANVYSLVGITAVGWFAGTMAAGFYKPAHTAISLTYVIPNLIFWVGLPLLNRATTSAVYRRVAGAMLASAVLYGLCVLMGIWWIGEPLLRLIYGATFLPSLPYVQVMSLIPLTKSISFVCAAVMLSNKRQRLRLGLQGIVALFSVAGAFVVIPQAGATGAAWLQVAIEAALLALYVAGAIWSLHHSRAQQRP